LADLEPGNDMSIGRVELSSSLLNAHQPRLVLLQKPDVSHGFFQDVAFVLVFAISRCTVSHVKGIVRLLLLN